MRVLKLSNSVLIFILLLVVVPVRANRQIPGNSQESGVSDPCTINSDSIFRSLNYSEIDFKQFYADKSLHYGREPVQVTGFWSIWMARILKVVVNLLNRKATPVILYLLVFSTCTYILIRYLRGEAESVWQSNKENSILFTEEGSEMTSSDLAALLQEEISAGNYNKAVRILFLQTIQRLADHGLISLHLEKTNSDFLHEISDAGIRNQFRELTRIYEVLWYGNQAVDQSYFDRIASQFHLFNTRING